MGRQQFKGKAVVAPKSDAQQHGKGVKRRGPEGRANEWQKRIAQAEYENKVKAVEGKGKRKKQNEEEKPKGRDEDESGGDDDYLNM